MREALWQTSGIRRHRRRSRGAITALCFMMKTEILLMSLRMLKLWRGNRLNGGGVWAVYVFLHKEMESIWGTGVMCRETLLILRSALHRIRRTLRDYPSRVLNHRI